MTSRLDLYPFRNGQRSAMHCAVHTQVDGSIVDGVRKKGMWATALRSTFVHGIFNHNGQMWNQLRIELI